ncbi:MAG: cell surface protein SprA [Bacteroidales bacterium]|nr:cell surface protein SprA [Bacteroidales bacterium]
MERILKYLFAPIIISYFVSTAFKANHIAINSANNFHPLYTQSINPPDTGKGSDLVFPIPEDDPDHPFYLGDPSNYSTEVDYDPETNEYTIRKKVGDTYIGVPETMDFDDYRQYEIDKGLRKYWNERASTANHGSSGGLIPKLKIGGEVFETIFGSNIIDIRPSGSAELIFGVIHNRRDDPALDIRQRRNTNFNFDEKIQMSVLAKVGDKIEFKTNYNTEAMFEFENKLKLKYEGKEDEIIKLIEAGDVTLPLSSTLIQGSQSLFGIKTQLQFGKTYITTVFSEQKGETQSIQVSGGAQTNQFYFKADMYEENKHFFISQYFRDNYNQFLEDLPLISSPINITKIEVWRTNIGAATQENRNIIAFTDLGEAEPNNAIVVRNPGTSNIPDNRINNLLTNPSLDTNKIRDINQVGEYLRTYQGGMTSGLDFEKVESARKLQPNEYTYNSRLGFISLNSSLSHDQVLAVAFQFTIVGDTTVYQVGEFTNEVEPPNNLAVKLLKSSSLNTKSPLWNLMMKNVYSLNAFQVNQDDFRLNILYAGDEAGVPTGFFTEGPQKGVPLIRLMGLDKINFQGDPTPDGVFDFIDNAATMGGTIQSSNGRIYFPVVEPFGKDLKKAIGDTLWANRYSFDSLYTLTKQQAQQYPDRNKFYLEGMYKSQSGSEISLNAMNVPQGSVNVTAGGIKLTENVDYTVDYTLGRVKIINEGILNSGTPINISMESQSQFSFQTKRMMGMHINHVFNNDFNVGATIMNLRERPLTQKINYGDEPINNTIWGMNVAYRTKSRLLTKIIDKLPFYSTKAESQITFDGEFAHFIPGHSRVIGKTGTTYIDDFEGSKSAIDMKNIGSWFLASTPQGQTEAWNWPEAAPGTGLKYGFNRAKLAWYVIDPIFYRNNSATPSNITKDDLSHPYAREVLETEVFPNKENPTNQVTNLAVLNLAFYPDERGPYNYDVEPISGISYGLNSDGKLNQPSSRWGGIMRRIESSDFDATNIEHVEFWMMDPFILNPNHTGGKFMIHLGDVSEDILRDGRKSYENGLPTTEVMENVDTTIWGVVPTLQALVNAFDNDPNSRQFQDVGYDGLSTTNERTFFKETYLDRIENDPNLGPNSEAYAQAWNDPSADNYHYFRGSDYDAQDVKILDRYKYFNNPEGNSPTDAQNPESYPTMATTLPNVEDINRDNTLSEDERYYQYTIELDPTKMNVGENFITDIYTTTVRLPNNTNEEVRWYQFKVPVREPQKVVGDIQGYNSIRFIRLVMKEFSEPIVCRLATFELVRGEWRTYYKDLLTNGDYVPGGDDQTSFNVSTVNIEENGKRVPVPYVLPPGIKREEGYSSSYMYKLNEQSLSLRISNLMDGDARAVYKTTSFDFRRFKFLRMYIHAEKLRENDILKDDDLTCFIRIGSDFTENYYEYEVPLQLTDWYTSAESPEQIWPEENEMGIELQKLVDAKQQRNINVRDGISYSAGNPYYELDGKNKITVVGMPNISDVRVIMIGIRNPRKQTLGDNDDMLPKSAEIWVNELRLTDFDNKSGWAATGRLRATLADLGDFSLAGTTSTPGFGSIEKKINERQQEYISSYDVATNIDFGKFFPEKWSVRVPMHVDYSKIVSSPEYNPLNPDTRLKSDIQTFETKAERDSIKHMTQDVTERKNINFMNVRKDRSGIGKARAYDIENFDFTYSYSETKERNVDIEYDVKKIYRGGLGYNFTANPKNYRPLSKVKFITKRKSLALIRDFNFYLYPKMFSFRTDINRQYNENKLRNKSAGLIIIEPTFMKTFDWNRTYNLRYDITQSLKIDYQATAMARIDEPQGMIDTREKKDSIWQNVLNAGRMNNFNHTFNVNYQIPINKIPMFNWITSSARFTGNFRWDAPPLSLQERMGNTIENSNIRQLNVNMNMINLYNKIPYLKKLNQAQQRNQRNQRGNPNIRRPQPQNQTVQADSVKKKPNVGKLVLDNTLKTLMMVRNISVSYSDGRGTALPGFVHTPLYFGNNLNHNAPGWGFVSGIETDINDVATFRDWITKDTVFNQPFMNKYNQNLNMRATIEPLRDFKIDITATRTFTENRTGYIKANAEGEYGSFSEQNTGNFSITFFAIGSAFVKDNKNYSNQNFEDLKDYRYEISQRLAAQNGNSSGINPENGYPDGYGPSSQDVLVPAFLAAYSGQDPSKIYLNTFPLIPMPNWRITYNGLSRIKWLEDYIQNVSITNAYTCTYNVNAFTSNIHYKTDDDGLQYVRDALNNFIPQHEIAQVAINEQFNPLFNIDATLKNSLMAKVEFKRSRNLALSFANSQLTEIASNEMVFGLGYRFKDIRMTFNFSGVMTNTKSDLNVKANVSIRDNRTTLRKIIENVNQISTGQKVVTINLSADYQLSQKFTVRAFYDHIVNRPHVSNQFPTSNINSGISVRFTLN